MELKENVIPREYQINIAKTASKKNTLVVLPTGTGKTLIAILVAIDRLKLYPESKVLMLAPTRPLTEQHAKTFKEFTNINPEEINVLSGKIKPSDRLTLYEKSKVIVATPQTVENDIKNNLVRLENYSLLIVDECHRSVKKYSYPNIAKKFMLQSKYPRILGLTASPGSSKERIEEICNNLFIDAIEIRSETDDDMINYIQPIEKENVYVELPENFKKAKILLEEAFKEDVYWLKERHYIPISNPTKKMLLDLQKKIMDNLLQGEKNPILFQVIIKVMNAIKIQYMLELLETQGVSFVYDYIKKLELSKKRNDKLLMKDPKIREVKKIIEDLYHKNIEHPKLDRLLEVVKSLIEKKSTSRIICFANYRATVNRINSMLNDNNIKSEILIGQSIKSGFGLSQKKQIETIQNFNDGVFNVLVASSIGEEGLSIKDVDAVIFYDAVASEIRKIQRSGRTGRTAPGKVIFIITKDTVDEAYYYASLKKEAKMKKTLYRMKNRGVVKRKISLLDWIKSS